MKKIFLMTALICLSFNLFSQEKIKQNQVGLVFNNFDNFGLSFKKGSDKFMWRFNAVGISGNKTYDETDTTSMKGFGINLSVGNEFIKKINDNFEFCFGYDLSYSYSQYKHIDDKSTSKSYFMTSYQGPGGNLVFGFNCIIKEHFVVGAELLPYFRRVKHSNFTGNKNSNSKEEVGESSTEYSYGLSNSARITLAYRF